MGKREMTVVAVRGHWGGQHEIGYWTMPDVKSGWVPLASVLGDNPEAPAVQAVVRALQREMDGKPETVDIVIGMRDGLFDQVGVYRSEARARSYADDLRREYGITDAQGAGVETNEAVIHKLGEEIIEGPVPESENVTATQPTMLDVDDVQAFLDLIALAEDKGIIKLREVEELKLRLGIQ